MRFDLLMENDPKLNCCNTRTQKQSKESPEGSVLNRFNTVWTAKTKQNKLVWI